MNITDPVEIIVAAALRNNNIIFTHESDNKGQQLDFKIVGGPFIECCQFHTPRKIEQLAPFPNVILIVGIDGAKGFAKLLYQASAPRLKKLLEEGKNENTS